MAAASPPPNPSPVRPADPSKPCPISVLPEDLWFHISDYVAASIETEFVVCTAQTVQNNASLPLSPLDYKHDHVLTGVPINGKLYITDVPDLGKGSFFGERYAYHSDPPPDGAEVSEDEEHVGPNAPGNPGMGLFGTCHRVTDNGPWYSILHREWGGSVDYRRTATNIGLPRHRFFKEATADKVRLRLSTDEEHVLDERHGHAEISLQGQTGLSSMIARLMQRRQRVHDMDAVQYMHLPGARATTKSGQLLVLALCKGLKIRSKLRICGVLPLMTRLDVHNPQDDLATMEEPFNLRPQMSYSLNKWLVVVPHKWISAMQSSVWKQQPPRVIPTRLMMQAFADGERAKDEPDDEGIVSNGTHHLRRSLVQEGGPTQLNVLMPGLRGRTTCVLPDTSFRMIAPMMVFAFFTCRNRFVNLNSSEDVIALLNRAAHGHSFREEFSLTGPHVIPAEEGKALKCCKPTAAAEDHFGLSPELELFGGFAGV